MHIQRTLMQKKQKLLRITFIKTLAEKHHYKPRLAKSKEFHDDTSSYTFIKNHQNFLALVRQGRKQNIKHRFS